MGSGHGQYLWSLHASIKAPQRGLFLEQGSNPVPELAGWILDPGSPDPCTQYSDEGELFQ